MFDYQKDSFFPFGTPTSFSGAQPPPKRLTYEEILAHLQPAAAAPEAPTPYGGFGDLPADQQRGGKLDALWAGLAALSGGLGSGNWGRAATEGTSAIQGIRENAVRQGNAQQEAGYQAKLASAQQQAQQERAKQQAAALAGMYNRATADEDPAGPFSQQAADAAQRGDMSALEKMASPETKSQRAAARARGLNPDAWDSIEQLKATLKDSIAKQSLETLSGPEAAAAAAKAKAEQDARLPGEKALKLAPSYQAPAQYEPLSRVFAREEGVQSIRDRHESSRATADNAATLPGKLHQMRDGSWALVRPPDAQHPTAWAEPIDGQPVADGKLRYFIKDQVQYVQNADHPELGAIEVRTYEDGEKGAPSIQQIRGGQAPPPRKAPPKTSSPLAALGRQMGGSAGPPAARPADPIAAIEAGVGRPLAPAVRAQVEADLRAGKSPAAIAAQIKEAMGVR